MIKIKKSSTADTRTCDWSQVSKEELEEQSMQHIGDVRDGMRFMIARLEEAALRHDHTKISEIDSFHADFKTGFKVTDWYEMHQQVERHHFKIPAYVPYDVNLIDVLEQLVDCVMAGMARSGEYRMELPDPELLVKAYENTAKLLLENMEVIDDK